MAPNPPTDPPKAPGGAHAHCSPLDPMVPRLGPGDTIHFDPGITWKDLFEAVVNLTSAVRDVTVTVKKIEALRQIEARRAKR